MAGAEAGFPVERVVLEDCGRLEAEAGLVGCARWGDDAGALATVCTRPADHGGPCRLWPLVLLQAAEDGVVPQP